MATDFLVCSLAVLLVHLARNFLLTPYIAPQYFRFHSRFIDYWWLIILLPALTVLVLHYNGYYQSQRVRRFIGLTGNILVASIAASLAAAVISFVLTPRGVTSGQLSQLFSGELVSRGILVLYPPLVSILLGLKAVIVRSLLLNLRRKGYNTRQILLVGHPQSAASFANYLQQHPYWGFQVVGLISENSSIKSSIPLLGNYADLIHYLETNVIDDVVFVPGETGIDSIGPLIRECEVMGVRTRLPLTLLTERISRPVLDEFGELSVITFNPIQPLGNRLLIKYMLDRVIAFFTLILLFPLMVSIAVIIKLTSANWRDPVFYGQIRCGLQGRHFTLWKFRSMHVNAEKERDELLNQNEMTGPVFKIRNDPRITSVGRWLRKFSLDELPQFWNVLRGDMSLVGPRPPLPDEVQRYDRWQRRRLSMKPGITCLWQVSGRNRLSFDTWMKMDLYYIDNWSLWLDCKILFRTIYVVATGYGAM